MSSILKALKKLDAQKSPAKTTGPDLSTSQESLVPQPRPWLPLAAGVALGALLVAALIVWYEKPATVAKSPITPTPVATESQIREQPFVMPETPPSVPPVAQQTEQAPPPEILKPSVKPLESKPIVVKPHPVVVQTQKPEPRPVPAVEQDVPKIPQGPSQDSAVKSAPVATAKTSGTPTGLNLIVSDIFFQEGSPDNMAVVNDLPVMEGTQIEGAIVEKILADRVVFKINDKQYDILRSSSAQ